MHRTVRKHENHGAIDIVVLYHPLSSSTVFTAASFNSVVVEPHFKCGYTIKESPPFLLARKEIEKRRIEKETGFLFDCNSMQNLQKKSHLGAKIVTFIIIKM